MCSRNKDRFRFFLFSIGVVNMVSEVLQTQPGLKSTAFIASFSQSLTIISIYNGRVETFTSAERKLHARTRMLHVKFINSKETGSQKPSGKYSSRIDKVPMISPIGRVSRMRNE